jgi:hypothetical protein
MRPERLISIQVDCLVFQPLKKTSDLLLEELSTMTYDKLNKSTRHALNFHSIVQEDVKSTAVVFKLKELKEPKKHGGVFKRHTCPHPVLEDLNWVVFDEPLEGPDEFAHKIYEHVMSGSSCMINGAPGSGKSFIVKELATKLREQKLEVAVIAPTNSASRIINGETCHAFLTRTANSTRPFQGILLIDEVSMLSLSLTAIIDQLRAGDCKIICVGDFQQLPPVSNSWRGTSVDPLILKESKMLKRWADCNLFVLRRCRRSDQKHFDFYTNLPTDLSLAIELSKQRYKKRSKVDLHLVISHRHRRELNNAEQDLFCHGEASISIPEQDDERAYNCVVGTNLIGLCSNRKIINGAFYQVISIDPLKIQDTLTDEIITYTPELLAKNCALAWSIVYNKAQGITIKDKIICLHDTHSRFFKRAHLYVGLSRVTNGNDIRFRSTV